MRYQEIVTDVLVIGSGATGLNAALHAAQTNDALQVAIIDKGVVGKSGSTVGAVQMTGAGKWSCEKDNKADFYEDTVISGKGLCNEDLVNVLVDESEKRITDLVENGLRLDQNEENELMVYDTPGHRHFRGISAGKGHTGLAISKALLRKINRTENITIFHDLVAIQLLKADGKVCGAQLYDLAKNQFIVMKSKAVVLATGGVGQLYPVTSNPVQATGDGFALALQAGAKLLNMEQVQFYPASLAYPESVAGFCISFYHLAKLYNSDGERFMERYEPEKMENVTRDRLSHAISFEVRAGRGTKNNAVWLDARDVVDRVKYEYPHEYNMCLRMGYDLSKDRIEVGPAAHFIMGGVQIDENTYSGIPGLYVAGETSGGLHGANRLVNNSITECVVFGARSGEIAAHYAENVNEIPEKIDLNKHDIVTTLLADNNHTNGYYPHQIKEKIKKLMGENVFVLREEKALKKAEEQLTNLQEKLRKVKIRGRDSPLSRDLLDFIEVSHMLLTCKAIVTAALERKESRGAHYRLDFPEAANDIEHTIIQLVNNKIKIDRKEKIGSV